MSKESRIEAQIQHFYDNVPDVGDSLPLKDYLLKHEDSRMAWYLLGKQYEAAGEHKKANYCFAQAGEIYEAFESKPAPSLPGEDVRQGGNGWRWALGLLLPVLLIGGAILTIRALAPGDSGLQSRQQSSFAPPGEPSAPAAGSTTGLPVHQPNVIIPADIIPPDQVAGASGANEEGQRILGSLLTAKPSSQPRLLIETPLLGKWNDWVKSGKPIASVTSDRESGVASIDWFDARWCECKPEDSNSSAKLIEGWKPAQEQKLALRSAIMRYKERTGNWPASPEALAGDYPANTMAGWTDNMTSWFDELKAVLDNKKDGKIPQAAGWPENTGPQYGHGTPAGQLIAMMEHSLEIIVDKNNHRLAVVSGNVILRNYAVGLGGSKTPEGSFVISEKVKDPNGSSTGVFGSRGMTLSDTRYGIHGTDEPASIGKDESLGCVRMKKEDIEELYDLVPMGTPVTIVSGGLPDELRAPAERFSLPSTQDETNPHKIYDWLH